MILIRIALSYVVVDGFRPFSAAIVPKLFQAAPLGSDGFRWAHLPLIEFLPAFLGEGKLGKEAASPPSAENFVARVRYGPKNTNVALPDLSAALSNSVCCSNSSVER
jgi:hypothetical protein